MSDSTQPCAILSNDDNQDSNDQMLPMSEFKNPFNEICLLTQHTDIVRLLICIDSKRYCSAGDDGLVIIWDTETGSLLHILQGHSRPITCLCPALLSIDGFITWYLLTASSDRVVCMWNVETGSLWKKYADQNSTTKCIVPLSSNDGLFCFAGEKLCLWSCHDGLLDVVPTDTSDDIQFVLVMKDDILIAAADTKIAFYKYHSSGESRLSLLIQYDAHRESVQSLVQLNDSYFVSGSVDGTVLQWSVDSLTVTHEYNKIEDFQGTSRTYPFSIQHLLPVDKQYLLCAKGCGLDIYDTKSCRQIFSQTNLHEGKVLHLELICKGYMLATCSEDSSIKLWMCSVSAKTSKKESPENQTKKILKCLDLYTEATASDKRLTLHLIGECQAHSAAVQMCLDVPPGRFLSCGIDHSVILWKNSIMESCRRHKMVRDALFRLNMTEDLSFID